MRSTNNKEPHTPKQLPFNYLRAEDELPGELYYGFELEDDSICNWMVDPIIRELDCNTPKGGIKDLYYVYFPEDVIKKFESDFFKGNAWKDIIK